MAHRIYLDNCCLNRPFDDLTQGRIKLEVEAIAAVVGKIKQREWIWITSAVLDDERNADPNEERRTLIERIFALPFERIELTNKDARRATELRKFGFKAYDAFHVAAAEAGKCDALLTTDDRLIALSRRHARRIGVSVTNPIDWLLETMS